MPCRIGDYTDFYTGIHHATNVGKLFRPDNPLLPNYKWVPIGYHGRARASASAARLRAAPWARRCHRRQRAALRAVPAAGLRARAGRLRRHRQRARRADEHGAGRGPLVRPVLLNDWSARDIQAWEYQPLGPFLAKNFATTISPWIVTLEALEPFRAPFERPAGDPQPLALPGLGGQPRARRDRHLAGGAPAKRGDARQRPAAARADAFELPRCVLDAWRRCWRTTAATAATCRPATCWAPARVRAAAGAGRVADRADAGRQAAADAAQRRNPHVLAGRRLRDPARLLRARRCAAHRFRRMPRHGAAGRAALIVDCGNRKCVSAIRLEELRAAPNCRA